MRSNMSAKYISSKGEEKDVETMPDAYLQNALNKAIDEVHDANIEVLSNELQKRQSKNGII
jgi:hypothetical protein